MLKWESCKYAREAVEERPKIFELEVDIKLRNQLESLLIHVPIIQVATPLYHTSKVLKWIRDHALLYSSAWKTDWY